ncbi:hypothetical protein [Acidithiobacillus sulfurivorans]|uniref:Transposase n=1 Tax=Acidithiobacillus sulfurivorans TaxID=1958756 RepID=A0ABS5ZWG9_9PROT|nr:hypothetical protein [Acidithiobacillus sulfurivorans]MBU2759524.1 hypothetical protein [Acidithiobacillus sulfurivorans]
MNTDSYGTVTRAKIAKNLMVEITTSSSGMCAEWVGERPPKLSRRQMARYRAARHKALTGLAERLGTTIIVAEG